MAPDTPFVSVIIPTYNRKDSLLRTLDSLRQQTLPADCYEVIVVDDGSTDGTERLDWSIFSIQVRYYWQDNKGATQARNAGTHQSSGEILVFMDDDIVATPGMLDYLVQKVSTTEQTIVLGTLVPALDDDTTNPFAMLYSRGAIFPGDVDRVAPAVCGEPSSEPQGCFVHFIQCKTGVLSIRRRDFYALDMFQDPTGGWPNWDDVDFGYRAHMDGVRLWKSHRAVAYHYDYSLRSLEANCARLERISKTAARLFERYPELVEYTAYRDKGPMLFSSDSPDLLVRKALRSLASSPACVFAMRQLSQVLEKHCPASFLLALLYRWILGAAMYKGYRYGLRN